LLLLLGHGQNKDSEMLSLSTSGVYSSDVSTASDSFVSQPLNSVDLLQNFYERSPTKQYLHSSATVEAISECGRALSSGVQEWEQVSAVSDDSRDNCEPSLSALSVSSDLLLDRDKTLLKLEHDTGKECVINPQSLAVNSCLHKSDESVIDTSSVISDSGVDSSTVSSHLCVSEVSTAEFNSSALQKISVEPKRGLHSRSASESGIFKPSQCFPNLSHHVYVHGNYKEGTA